MPIRLYLLAETNLTGGLEEFFIDRNLRRRRDDCPSDAEKLVEDAGRICYMSFNERQKRYRNDEYIENIIQQGHESVLEHANFTILVDGISRGLSHQLVRHRVGFSYSQLSQQYFDETPVQWAMPPELNWSSGARNEWNKFIEEAEKTYESILTTMKQEPVITSLTDKEADRFRRSVARSVLPNATATTLVITANARAWRHFLSIRGSIPGDLEMREYCVLVFKILASRAKNLFADYEVVSDSIGEMVKCRKNK